MTLPDCMLVVAAEVDPAVEEAWNAWYDEVHLPEIATCPGFEEAARYVSEADGRRHYLAVYRLDGPAALESREFAERRGWGAFAGKVAWTTRVYRRIT